MDTFQNEKNLIDEKVEEFMLSVCKAVKKYMRDSGVSQESLAKTVGLSQGNLSRKLSNYRNWRVRDLASLASAGVELPDFKELANGR